MAPSTPQTKLLLTSIGSTAAQNLLWALQSAPTPWLCVGANAEVPSSGHDLVNVEEPLPFGDSPDYIDCIVALIAKHEVNLFIPVMEPELLAASVARERLDKTGVLSILSPRSAIELCRSKAALLERFDELGVPHPLRVLPREAAMPVFARPTH